MTPKHKAPAVAAPPSSIAEVSVLVPWRDSGPDRATAWAYVRALWTARHPDWQIVTGDATTDAWSKGAALADALARAEGRILVVADADVWCDGTTEAVQAVSDGAAWAVPHYRVCRLTSLASADVYETGEWPRGRSTLTYAQRPYSGRLGGGIVVLPREHYERAPIDPRFVGWGQEDDAWALALTRVYGKAWRGTEDLWHLWHAPPPRQSRAVGSGDSWRLYKRYACARDRIRMIDLLSEMS